MPEDGLMIPAIIFIRVDLPDPFLPTITAESPAESSKLMPLKIVFPEYFFVRSFVWMLRSGIVSG